MQQRLYKVEDLKEMDGEFELDRGVLVPVMPGGEGHGYLCAKVTATVWNYVKGHKLGRTLSNDPGFILERNPDTLRGPDVAFVRTERLGSVLIDGFPEGYPDLAVEVVSPVGALTEAIRKTTQYLDAGTLLVWVIDIGRRRVLVFRNDGTTQTFTEGDTLDGEDVLPGFRWPLDEIFADE